MYKIVVSDPKTRHTYQKEVAEKESGLLGRKIRDMVKGDFFGLPGYELQITGGSDKQGFPMRQNLQGIGRKKALLTGGPGFHPLRKGERRRKLVRGNTLSEEIVQVNMKVVVHGKDSLAKLFGKEEAKEEKKEHKEKAEEKKEAKPEGKKEEHKKEEKAETQETKREEHKGEHKAEHKEEHKTEHKEAHEKQHEKKE